MKKKEIMYLIFGITIGIIMGLILAYTLFTLSVIDFLKASEGIISNLQINLNETKLAEETFRVINNSLS